MTSNEQVQPFSLLNEKDAARILGVSHRTLQMYRVRGYGPKFVRMSGRSNHGPIRTKDLRPMIRRANNERSKAFI